MTLARRVARLEGSLSSQQAVLAWLAEAQQFPSLTECARATLDTSVEEAPLTRIGERVEAAVRGAARGASSDELQKAIQRAVGDAVVLYVLVLQLNVTALEFTRLEGLRAAALFYRMAALEGDALLLDAEVASEAIGPQDDIRWRDTRVMLASLADAIEIEEMARVSLERRFLDGNPALFDDADRGWTSLREQVERITRFAQPTPMSPATPTRPGGTDAALSAETAERVRERAAELADDARVTAYELLGERERASTIMERRLRTFLGRDHCRGR